MQTSVSATTDFGFNAEDHIQMLIKKFQDAILAKGESTIWDAIRYAKSTKPNFNPVSRFDSQRSTHANLSLAYEF